MKRYVVGVAVTATMLMGIPALASAHARTISRAHKGKTDLVVVGKGHRRQELYVQRTQASMRASAASCLAGQLTQNYCTPPVQDNLFGSFSYDNGSTTFGSANTTNCKALGYSAAPCGVYTSDTNELIVAFVSADGPRTGGQSITVSCILYNGTAAGAPCPVTFHRVAAENAAGGDSEVWYADATRTISKSAPIFVTARVGTSCGGRWNGCDVSLQAVTFKNAITPGAPGVQGTGVGASSTCYSTRAAPSCSLTTTEPDSQVWASVMNPTSATIPTWPSGQFAIGVADNSDQSGTFYDQFAGTCSGACSPMALPPDGLYQNPFTIAPTVFGPLGTTVKINDTAPTNQAFDMVDVEIL
jgi:hypothetical protein